MKDKDDESSSFAQKAKGKGGIEKDDQIVCYCCGDPDCLLPRCSKKDTLPAHL